MSDKGFDDLIRNLGDAAGQNPDRTKPGKLVLLNAVDKSGLAHTYLLMGDNIKGFDYLTDPTDQFIEFYALDRDFAEQYRGASPDEIARQHPQLRDQIKHRVFGILSGGVLNGDAFMDLRLNDFSELGIVHSLIDLPLPQARPALGMIAEAFSHQLNMKAGLSDALRQKKLEVNLQIMDRTVTDATFFMNRLFPNNSIELIHAHTRKGPQNRPWQQLKYALKP